MRRRSWIDRAPEGHPIEHLPYGSFDRPGESARLGVAIGDQVLDLASLASAGVVDGPVDGANLDRLLVAGPGSWADVRSRLTALLTDEQERARVEPHLVPASDCRLRLPFTVA